MESTMVWKRTVTLQSVKDAMARGDYTAARRFADTLKLSEDVQETMGLKRRKQGKKAESIFELYAIRVDLEVENLKKIFESLS